METIPITDSTDNLAYAMDRLLDTSTHSFMTGPAGTGKTTLMKKFMKDNEGLYVALAPTGIAAVNIGGQTIHSFFGFPARPVSFDAIKKLNPDLPQDYAKLKIWKKIKYIIIDEISMVRADLMDQIHWFCIKNFGTHTAFAGKKLIMVGDLDQLPPVVSSEEEKAMIKSRYNSEFFFSSNCWKHESFDPYKEAFEYVGLTKIWRQSDPEFINLLNNIKSNRITEIDIDRLNRRCVRDGVLSPSEGIMLCTTNVIAADTNNNAIKRIEGDSVLLEGSIKNKFEKKDCPVEYTIELKPGCRIMTMRNSNDPDNLYYNGSMGKFIRVEESTITDDEGEEVQSALLIIELDNGAEVFVPRYIFENVEYTYDEDKDKIVHKVVGEFVQYPIKLAYAMTIHKSQGQTFDKVIVDLGRGAFAHGQVYVALSRCRSLEGLILRRNLSKRDLIYAPKILDFNKLKAEKS